MHMHVQAHVYKHIVHYAYAVGILKAETKAMIVFKPPSLLFSIFLSLVSFHINNDDFVFHYFFLHYNIQYYIINMYVRNANAD